VLGNDGIVGLRLGFLVAETWFKPTVIENAHFYLNVTQIPNSNISDFRSKVHLFVPVICSCNFLMTVNRLM